MTSSISRIKTTRSVTQEQSEQTTAIVPAIVVTSGKSTAFAQSATEQGQLFILKTTSFRIGH